MLKRIWNSEVERQWSSAWRSWTCGILSAKMIQLNASDRRPKSVTFNNNYSLKANQNMNLTQNLMFVDIFTSICWHFGKSSWSFSTINRQELHLIKNTELYTFSDSTHTNHFHWHEPTLSVSVSSLSHIHTSLSTLTLKYTLRQSHIQIHFPPHKSM